MSQTTEWTAQQCAEHWGVSVRTWHGYVARNRAPQPIRRVGRTPLWDADTVRVEGAARPRAGQLTDIRLPLVDILRPLRIDMATATDPRAPEDERAQSTQDALDTLRLLRTVVRELAEHADERCRQEAAREGRDADELRTIWDALAGDLRRVDGDLDRRRRGFYTATHPDEGD